MHSKTGVRASNEWKINTHPLYSKPCRVCIPVVQGLLIASSLGIVITGAIYCAVGDLAYQNAGAGVAAFLIWAFIPFVAWIISIVQTVQRRRRTLTCKQVVFAGTVSLLGWVGYGAMGAIDDDVGGDYNSFIVLPMLCIPGLALNAIYLVCGVIALRRQKVHWTKTMATAGNFELERSANAATAPRYSEASGKPSSDGGQSMDLETRRKQ